MVRFWPFQLKTDKSDNWWSDVNWFLSHSEFFLNINYHFYRILTGIIKKKVWVDFNCIHITLIINDSYFDSAPNCIEKIFCSHNSAFENTPVVPLFATPPFRNTAPFSQHFFDEWKFCLGTPFRNTSEIEIAIFQNWALLVSPTQYSRRAKIHWISLIECFFSNSSRSFFICKVTFHLFSGL